ncbi:helix-turn-helix domain-containing protein [Pseudonocardia sp. CA-107938]|uniref:helix-turn-helix domain-containing protein n=1 Tax=Pseudonocardia sp. CA-107938 TaxID=3240021 RepID=UPI003D916A7E
MTHPARIRLAERLRAVRAPRFRSGSALARHLGWQQSKVSRIELGQQLPSREDLDQWIAAVGADSEELHQLLDDAHVQTVSIRAAARSAAGVPGVQVDLADLERRSTLVAEYQPHMVPGLAQTASYARSWLTQADRPEVLASVDVEGVINARIARQAILYQPGHDVVIAIGEAGLRNSHGDPSVQRQQLGHLQVLAELPTVTLLVEPAHAAMATMRGFRILDDRVVLEDTEGARHLTDPAIVGRFTAALAALRSRALAGEDAVAFIRKVERAL